MKSPKELLAEIGIDGFATEHELELLSVSTNDVTTIGDALELIAKRRLLHKRLRDANWNLLETAKSCNLAHGSGPLLRMIRELHLTAEYEAAKASGLIRRGPRTDKAIGANL